MIVLFALSLFFTFFPYISFVYTGTDIQPYSLVVNMAIFIILIFYHKIKKLNKVNLLLFIPVILSITLIFFSENKFSGFRSLYGYLNLAVSLIVYSYIIAHKEKLFLKFLTLSVYTWTIVAIIQTFFLRSFLFFLLPRNSEAISIGESRGVNSLAPEPTFYGLVTLFMILVIILIPSERLKSKNYLLILLILSIILLSKSSMTILFLFLFLFLFLLIHFFSLKNFLMLVSFLSLTVILITYIDFSFLADIRVYKLFQIAIENPLEVATIDASMNDRVSAIYFSLKGFFTSWLLPHSYGAYSEFLKSEVPHSDYFWYVTINDRIKSYYGSIFFELGAFGMIIFISISYYLYKYYSYSKKMFLLFFLFFNSILFSAIPLSLPLVPLYLATLHIYKKN